MTIRINLLGDTPPGDQVENLVEDWHQLEQELRAAVKRLPRCISLMLLYARCKDIIRRVEELQEIERRLTTWIEEEGDEDERD